MNANKTSRGEFKVAVNLPRGRSVASATSNPRTRTTRPFAFTRVHSRLKRQVLLRGPQSALDKVKRVRLTSSDFSELQ
jgi:hypothetical protein